MKNSPLHIDENELDLLLRQMLLEENADTFTQNSLVMNAEIIFGLERTRNVSIRAAKEKEMIAKLEEAFVRRKGFGKFWLNGIVLALLVSTAAWIFKANQKNFVASFSPLPSGQTENFIGAYGNDTSGGSKNDVPEKMVSNVNYLPVTDTVVPADTSLHFTPAAKKEHYVTPDTHIPIEKDWYAGNYIVSDVPGPVFSAKASPENFKPAQGYFKARFNNNMFTCKQDSFLAAYYTGAPFKSGMNDMIYFNFGEYVKNAKAYTWMMPWTILEYADPADVKIETVFFGGKSAGRSYDWLFLYKLPEEGIQIAMEPFYFRKYEVTNKEYREFINWVRAANGYANKPIIAGTIDTVEVKDPLDHNGEQIVIKGKNYRILRTSTPVEDYKDVFNYIFFDTNSDAVKTPGKNSVYVMPDTISWVSDFTFSFNEPMANMYFWHPAYDNYPVVGVNWYQAAAFLDWKTHMHQKQLDAEKIPYTIEYALPSEIEWELASVSQADGKNIRFDFHGESGEDWLTNLGIKHPQDTDNPNLRTNYLKNLFTKDQYFRGDFIADGYFHTGPADLSAQKKNLADNFKHIDAMDISWMDGNVSEWMSESYAQNWMPFFQKHLAVLATDTSESTRIAREIEMLYDKSNAKNGRLVRGANWYDERFGERPASNRNDAGMSPKRFIDPAEQHSTIGFRYVIHVRRK